MASLLDMSSHQATASAAVGLTSEGFPLVFPSDPKPAPGSPNVVAIVLDDTGFAHLGNFGSDIATPNMDRLAHGGLRYNRFHVTSLCSPTRAAFLTGRNHHAVGMGFLADIPLAYPGYTARIAKSAGTLARILRDAGYSTLAVGKWHLTPRFQRSAAGPFELWPLGLGFERYYGFLQGDTNHWTPTLVRDIQDVDPPAGPAAGRRRRIPPDRGPDRDGAALRARPAPCSAGEAVLLVLRARGDARPAPRGTRVGRPLPRALRPRVGRVAPGDLRTPAIARRGTRGHHLDGAPVVGGRLGCGAGEPASDAHAPAGGVRRVPHPHRRPDRRAGRSVGRDRSTR